MASMAMVVAPQATPILGAQPAAAHYSEHRREGHVFWNPTLQVFVQATQNHDYVVFHTYARHGTSLHLMDRDPGEIRHKGQLYKSGGPLCANILERWNTTRTFRVTTQVLGNIWSWCNHLSGGGPILVTFDYWGWVGYQGGWYPTWGGAAGVRPMTSHYYS